MLVFVVAASADQHETSERCSRERNAGNGISMKHFLLPELRPKLRVPCRILAHVFSCPYAAYCRRNGWRPDSIDLVLWRKFSPHLATAACPVFTKPTWSRSNPRNT
jgi:hypothetical protein